MRSSLIVVGASAGGLHTTRELLAQLPADLNAAVLLVIHTHPGSPGFMDRALDSAGGLRVCYAGHRQPIEPGHAYVAPPDHHLLVEGTEMLVVRGPKEHYHRPSVDALFRAAAAHHGSHVIGIILTGYLTDGTAGARAVKQCGGRLIVQDPKDAEVPEMPASVLKHMAVDHCVAVQQMGALIVEMTQDRTASRPTGEQGATREREPCVVEQPSGRPIPTCPQCGGLVWEVTQGGLLRYHCDVPHPCTALQTSAV